MCCKTKKMKMPKHTFGARNVKKQNRAKLNMIIQLCSIIERVNA